MPAAGRYRVHARWVMDPVLATDAPFTIHHSGGATTINVNQKINGGRWMTLGEYDLAPSSGHKVVLTNDANGRVVADAIRFKRIGDSRLVVADAIKIVPNDAEDALYVHADHLGSQQKVTDATAAIVWDAAMTPFGTENAITGTETNNSRFPGQYYDTETGLHYNWHRYYEPRTGRYITADPIGLAGGLNVYGYVGGNPVGFIDPDGQAPHVVVGALLGGIAGGVGAWLQGGGIKEVFVGAGVGAALGAYIAAVPFSAPAILGSTLGRAGLLSAGIGAAGSGAGQLAGGLLLGKSLECIIDDFNFPALIGAGLGAGGTGLLVAGATKSVGKALSLGQSISLGIPNSIKEGIASGVPGNLFGPEEKCGCKE